MTQSSRPTLVRPPDDDASKSQIENVLELTELKDIGPDIFTNTRPLWHPPGARGIYGGSAIAQCLAAAQATIPPPSAANGQAQFWVHSMHCYFVLAGDSAIPVMYYVERVRDGKSFKTRTVQARQRGRCIFTTTLSFVREGSAGSLTVEHGAHMPEGMQEFLEETELMEGGEGESEADRKARNGEEGAGPFESRRLATFNNSSPKPDAKRSRQWIRARGKISPSAGQQAHLSALAYMSDSFFIGTIGRVHNLWRFARPQSASSNTLPPEVPTGSTSPSTTTADSNSSSITPQSTTKKHPMAALEEAENAGHTHTKTIGMMVSLDHTIYFHRPREIRADQWLFSEMESPWAGDGRGLVLQKMWNREGELVATCVQEGLVRLVQPGESKL